MKGGNNTFFHSVLDMANEKSANGSIRDFWWTTDENGSKEIEWKISTILPT